LGLVGEDEAVEDALEKDLVLGGELRHGLELQPEAVVGSALVLVEDDVVASVPNAAAGRNQRDAPFSGEHGPAVA
jgi:hypothetical protein